MRRKAASFRSTPRRATSLSDPSVTPYTFKVPASMSTLADELLNDFEDSGSEGEGDQQNGFLQDGPSPPATNGHHTPTGSMVLDGDEENVDSDDAMEGIQGDRAVVDVEDEEEAKAKVEKMQLGGVNDVRSVAGLMKTLEPVLEVCTSLYTLQSLCADQCLHLS